MSEQTPQKRSVNFSFNLVIIILILYLSVKSVENGLQDLIVLSLVNENPYQARIISLLNGTFLSLQSSEDQFYIYFIHVQKYLLLYIVAKKNC